VQGLQQLCSRCGGTSLQRPGSDGFQHHARKGHIVIIRPKPNDFPSMIQQKSWFRMTWLAVAHDAAGLVVKGGNSISQLFGCRKRSLHWEIGPGTDRNRRIDFVPDATPKVLRGSELRDCQALSPNGPKAQHKSTSENFNETVRSASQMKWFITLCDTHPTCGVQQRSTHGGSTSATWRGTARTGAGFGGWR